MFHPAFNLLLPRGVLRSPHPGITYATACRVAPGTEKLYYGEPPVNIQFLHTFKFLKTLTLVAYYYDRNHLQPVSLLDLIEVESEHKNTTVVEVAPTPAGCFLFKPLGRLLKFPLLSSIHGLPCIALLFTGYFLKFILEPFP